MDFRRFVAPTFDSSNLSLSRTEIASRMQPCMIVRLSHFKHPRIGFNCFILESLWNSVESFKSVGKARSLNFSVIRYVKSFRLVRLFRVAAKQFKLSLTCTSLSDVTKYFSKTISGHDSFEFSLSKSEWSIEHRFDLRQFNFCKKKYNL